MVAWGIILLFAGLLVSFAIQGWLLYRAARWLDIELEPVWATVVVFVASVIEGIVSLAIFLVLFGPLHFPSDRSDAGLQRWSDTIAPALFWPEVISPIGGFIAFVATIAVMLDLSLARAAALSVLFLIFQAALGVFTVILCGNMLLLTVMWSGS